MFKNHSKLCVPNEENHRVVKPPVVEEQEDIECSIPVQETGGKGGASQVGTLYTKSGAKITSNTAKPGKKNLGMAECIYLLFRKKVILYVSICIIVFGDFLVANMHTLPTAQLNFSMCLFDSC